MSEHDTGCRCHPCVTAAAMKTSKQAGTDGDGVARSSDWLTVGDRVSIISGVYRGRSGIVCAVGEHWFEVKPDQIGVGGLNPRGCMVIGAKSEWVKTAKEKGQR